MRLCDYCYEEPAVKSIPSPNGDDAMWKVCPVCGLEKEVDT